MDLKWNWFRSTFLWFCLLCWKRWQVNLGCVLMAEAVRGHLNKTSSAVLSCGAVVALHWEITPSARRNKR